MDKDTVTLRIRERLDARMLPRVIPSLMREPGRPTSPRGNIYKDSSIGVAKCAACDDPGAQIAYQFPDGRILLLESLPSRSFPDARVLIVVPENDTTLYEHLQRRFAGVRYVQVIRERRAGDRRREPCFVTDDLRHQTRRIREGKVSPLGYVVVRFKPIGARRIS